MTRLPSSIPAFVTGALLALAFAAAPARAQSAPAPAATGAAQAVVSYVAGGTVYVSAGAANGLRQGDTLLVVRGGQTVARVLASVVSTRRAACDTLWTAGPVAMGDAVRFRPDPAVVAALVDSLRSASARVDSAQRNAVLAPPAPKAAAANRPRTRGRIGARWLSVETSEGSRFQQPALDLRFDGQNQADNHLDMGFDMRTRRTTRNFTGGTPQTEATARVYRAAVTVRSRDANRRFTVGRQSSPTLASVSLFDGALLEAGNGRRTIGLFSGTQPDPVQYQFSPDILQSGAYVEWHQAPLAVQRWSVAVGGVTSQQGGQPNRDFGFAQTYWFGKGVNLSTTQEIDFNRGWKRRLGEPALSPTSTYGSLRVPVTRWFAVQSGYDNRRNVRLYRDRLTPETQFDDAYRQGAWAGGEVGLVGRFRVSGESRFNSGSDRSHSWSGSAEAFRFAPLHVSARVRTSRFYGASVETRLTSLGLGFDPLPLSHLEAGGGVRSTHDGFSGLDDSERWWSLDADLTLGRRWYLNGGYEYDHGGSVGNTTQAQAGLSWRF